MRESIDLESSQLIQRVVAAFLGAGHLLPHLGRLRALVRTRREALGIALDGAFAGCARWTSPQGGIFAWVSFAEALDTTALLERSLAAGVAFVPGAGFAADGATNISAVRLNHACVSPQLTTDGIRRLAAAHQQLHDHPKEE